VCVCVCVRACVCERARACEEDDIIALGLKADKLKSLK
jgi:hypothetical protein